MTDDDIYMTDPRAKTVEGYIAGLTILSGYMERGMQQSYFCGAEHDVIHIYVGSDECPEDSQDGKALSALGFHCDDDAWGYLT